MRCDVCDTKIPPGSDRCPNCGYRVRESSIATHKQAISTEYPEPEVFQTKRKRQRKINTQNIFQTRKQFSSYKNVISFIILVSVVIGFVGSMISKMSVRNYDSNVTSYSGGSFQEGLDLGIDDGSIQMAMDSEGELTSFFYDELLISDVEINENYYYFSNSVSASVNVYGYDDDFSFDLSMTYQNQRLYHESITLSWNSEESIRENPIQLDSQKIEKINERFDVDIEKIIETYRLKMVVDENDETVYVASEYNENNNIYLSESVNEKDYFVFLSIGKDIE